MSLGGSLLLLLLAETPLAGQMDPAPAEAGPRATSGASASDAVGYATIMTPLPEGPLSPVMVAVTFPPLPAGSFVELTALDSGRTIAAQVLGGPADEAVVALSPGAARQLGVGDHAPVRVRAVTVSVADREALLAGKSVAPRLDAPPALLAALRRKLSEGPAASPPGDSPATAAARGAPSPAVRPWVAGTGTAPKATSIRGSWTVQVMALSSGARAATLARTLGGKVLAGGGLYRVQLGPYADPQSAKRARDGIARAGYGDARILHSN
ncbi:SPOR domain-containing protein [Sphingomonas sp. CARO-RG-8B-R24-01]|uniref:SPOR domain-containing protein n=1 Tax=Sphingomonas sp. CARO-RG-8B-R24-01 TaxID=2914831 RepID=UPI001F57C638|nr:SPOR domain-containing protein [Sphingomonas sp. CARO-RG-8B-R24-01]